VEGKLSILSKYFTTMDKSKLNQPVKTKS